MSQKRPYLYGIIASGPRGAIAWHGVIMATSREEAIGRIAEQYKYEHPDKADWFSLPDVRDIDQDTIDAIAACATPAPKSQRCADCGGEIMTEGSYLKDGQFRHRDPAICGAYKRIRELRRSTLDIISDHEDEKPKSQHSPY
jgi:hypothetical protein